MTKAEKIGTEPNEKKPMWKRVVDISVNILCAVIVIFVMIVSISTIASQDKSYTVIFGLSFFTVQSESMQGDNEDSFNKGDMITVRTIDVTDQTAINKLEVGNIITYNCQKNHGLTSPNGEYPFINTHRIVQINYDAAGNVESFVTKGDNNENRDPMYIGTDYLIGVYRGKASFIGQMFTWMRTVQGFMVMMIVPALLVVGYCAYLVIKQVMLRGRSKVKVLEADLYEQAKREALEELKRQQAEQAAQTDKTNDEGQG